MKIISKYKDYYDYLSGIYGIDDKIVLDRRRFDHPVFTEDQKVTLYICDTVYEGYYKSGKFYWCSEAIQIANKTHERFWTTLGKDFVYINDGGSRNVAIHINPFPDKKKTNTVEGCSIMIPITYGRNETVTDYLRYPILKKLKFPTILPAKDIYLMLSAWLAPKDNFADNRTDKEKIVGAGFDIKTSFRNVK